MRDFLTKILLRGTSGFAYVCSLKNDRSDPDGPTERHILTRNLDGVVKFATKYDVEGRGTYLCVSTLKKGARRIKANAIEKLFAHCDIDTKSVGLSIEEIIKILKAVPKPPSIIVISGHGVHAYWLLDMAHMADDDVEDLDKAIADMFGGDRQVAQRVALLRLPGTHNTKGGKWLDVTIAHDSDVTYTFDELVQWASDSDTIIPRIDKPKVEEEDDDPFLRYAKEYSFKAPIDVDQRLAEMEYGGVEEKGVHATQLAVTASMLAAGHDVEEVVQKVLEATKKIAPENWNMKEEEKTIRGMCKSWGRKLEKKEKAKVKKAVGADVPDTSNVVSLAEKRAEKEEKEAPKGKPKKGTAHLILAKGFLETLTKRGDAILISREEVWRCTKGLWESLPPGEAKAWLDRELEEGCRKLGVISTQKLVSEARAWIMRNPEIYMEDVPWDEHGKIACRSGLLDPETLEIEEIRPDHYVTMRIECDYDPKAKCPKWLRMLDDIFLKDEETKAAIQEIAGTGLLLDRPRQLQRALIFVGAPMSGKSNLLNILSGMFTRNPNTTSFDLLENTHGTTDFLRNVPWVLHEAFDQAKWHFSSIVKSLLSGDPITINIKNGPMVDRKYKMPVFWGTNSPPQFKEASRAIETRVRIVKCKQVFDPSVMTGIAKEAHDKGYASPSDYVLATEMPGLLNWFLAGMKRAVKRGYLMDTEEMLQASRDLRVNSNIMAGFFDDAVDYSSSHMISVPDLLASFQIWWEENKGEGRHVPSSDMVTKSIESMYDARIAVNGKELRFNLMRYIAGIKLNDMGLALWSARFNSAAVRGDTLRMSEKEEDVNKKIPEEWYLKKKSIMTMVEAHKEKKK